MNTPPSNPTADPNIFCKQCGYDLRGCLEQRCPECGRGYDPADAKTFAKRPPKDRRWLKRGLATFLTVLVLLGGAWGWLYWEWKEEQQALAKLNKVFSAQPPVFIGPDWLGKLLGPTAFVLDRIEYLSRNASKVNADQLEAIKAIKWLGRLNLSDTSVSDISPLASLTALEKLRLDGTQVSNLSPLFKLTALKILYVPKETITEVQVKEMRRALPNCQIERQ